MNLPVASLTKPIYVRRLQYTARRYEMKRKPSFHFHHHSLARCFRQATNPRSHTSNNPVKQPHSCWSQSVSWHRRTPGEQRTSMFQFVCLPTASTNKGIISSDLGSDNTNHRNQMISLIAFLCGISSSKLYGNCTAGYPKNFQNLHSTLRDKNLSTRSQAQCWATTLRLVWQESSEIKSFSGISGKG